MNHREDYPAEYLASIQLGPNQVQLWSPTGTA